MRRATMQPDRNKCISRPVIHNKKPVKDKYDISDSDSMSSDSDIGDDYTDQKKMQPMQENTMMAPVKKGMGSGVPMKKLASIDSVNDSDFDSSDDEKAAKKKMDAQKMMYRDHLVEKRVERPVYNPTGLAGQLKSEDDAINTNKSKVERYRLKI